MAQQIEPFPIPKVKGDKKTLWNVLPFVGLQGSPIVEGVFTDFTMPQETSTYLKGTPLRGVDNTGINPNLRVLTFQISNPITGPVIQDDVGPTPRPRFFNNSLLHQIKWKIMRNRSNTETVNIGFYTVDYLRENNPDNLSMLILTNKGPAFYTASCENKYSGLFHFTNVVELFVIVDADVDMEMKVTVKSPEDVVYPELKLFIPIAITDRCGNIVAYQQLISDNDNNYNTVITPAEEYIELSNSMIQYLTVTAVTLNFSVTSKNEQLTVFPPEIYNNISMSKSFTRPDYYSLTSGLGNRRMYCFNGDNYWGFDLRHDGVNPSTPTTVNLTGINMTFPAFPAPLAISPVYWTYIITISVGRPTRFGFNIYRDMQDNEIKHREKIGINGGMFSFNTTLIVPANLEGFGIKVDVFSEDVAYQASRPDTGQIFTTFDYGPVPDSINIGSVNVVYS